MCRFEYPHEIYIFISFRPKRLCACLKTGTLPPDNHWPAAVSSSEGHTHRSRTPEALLHTRSPAAHTHNNHALLPGDWHTAAQTCVWLTGHEVSQLLALIRVSNRTRLLEIDGRSAVSWSSITHTPAFVKSVLGDHEQMNWLSMSAEVTYSIMSTCTHTHTHTDLSACQKVSFRCGFKFKKLGQWEIHNC